MWGKAAPGKRGGGGSAFEQFVHHGIALRWHDVPTGSIAPLSLAPSPGEPSRARALGSSLRRSNSFTVASADPVTKKLASRGHLRASEHEGVGGRGGGEVGAERGGSREGGSAWA